MEEIEFSRWLFEGRLRQGKNLLPVGLNQLCYIAGNSKSHCENSISFIFLESPHQVDMKNVVKCYKHFFGYFNALKTHCDVLDWHLWLLWSVKFLCGRLRPCVGLLPYSQMPSHQSFGMQMCIASGQGLAQFVHTAHIPTVLPAVVCIIQPQMMRSTLDVPIIKFPYF